MRTVVLLCGPPGAGKSTLARQSGMEVYDRDDAAWATESQFLAALDELGQRHEAQAVVIRSGATSTARARWADRIRATHTFMVLEPPAVSAARVRARGRADMVRTLAGVRRWWSTYDDRDQVQRFTSWAALDDSTLGLMTE